MGEGLPRMQGVLVQSRQHVAGRPGAHSPGGRTIGGSRSPSSTWQIPGQPELRELERREERAKENS